jgi:agmatine/peptidylarginine deiminase
VKRRLLAFAGVVLVTIVASLAVLRRGPAHGSSLTEYDLFYAPTAPVRLQRMLTESTPASALVVALPEAQVLGNARKETFFLRLIEVASQYVKVVVLVNRDEPFAIQKIRGLISARAADPAAVLERVSFARAVVDTEWVRDYGPIFGIAENHDLVLLDNMYRDVRSESQTERQLTSLGFVKTAEKPARTGQGGPYLSDYGHFWRRNDDAAPMYFNEILYGERRRFAPLVRSPLQLSGGDVQFTEDAQMFTSTRTLEVNGGDERRFSRLAMEYFSARRVNYLRPLPNGIWHIDMFVKMAGRRVVLLAELADDATPQSPYLRQLRREAAEILEWNRALIADRLPGVEIVRVPMPGMVEAGNGRLASTGRTGIAELDSAVEARGLQMRPLATVMYRSFLNSVFINGETASAVLVPRFTGFEAMEPAVEKAYRRAYPGADVRFINADVMAEEFGGIHCVTVTLPAAERARADAMR